MNRKVHFFVSDMVRQ